MADDSSVLVPFSALNVHQNTELNPEAPEYVPFLHHHNHHHTTNNSSAFFYFQSLHHQRPCLPPLPQQPPQMAYVPLPVSYFFHPLIHLAPQHHLNHIPPVQQQLTWSQPCADQAQGSDDIDRGGRVSAGNDYESRRCCSGRWKKRVAGFRVWRVKSGQRSSTDPMRRNGSASDVNRESRVTPGSSPVNEGQRMEGSCEWRTVKYRTCRRFGKKFEIQPVEKSVKKTTVMIRNIPSRYTRETMLTFLDRHCMEVNQNLKQSCYAVDDRCCISAYDFFYMPMDFKTGLNKSYAFVNFTTPEAVWRFHQNCDTQKWELFESNKIRQIALAKLQGTEKLIEHFGRTVFACDRDEFLPVYFQPPRDGRADVESVTSLIGKRVN